MELVSVQCTKIAKPTLTEDEADILEKLTAYQVKNQ